MKNILDNMFFRTKKFLVDDNAGMGVIEVILITVDNYLSLIPM